MAIQSPKAASELMRQGSEIAWSLAGMSYPNTGSPLYALAANRVRIAHGGWSDQDFAFQFEALR